MSLINQLKNIPDIDVIEKDADTILNNLVTVYQNEYKAQTGKDKTLYQGERDAILLKTATLKFYQLMIYIELLFKQNFLKYAKGTSLDNIAATRHSETRKGAEYALVPMKFKFYQALEDDYTIPAGTRVTAGDNIYFTINEDVVVNAGESEIKNTFTCMTSGAIGNGYKPGTINTLADPLSEVISVENTEISQGGADKQSDDSLTEITYNAPEGYAVAGPKPAYEFHAKKFSTNIKDVVAYRPKEEFELLYKFTDNEQEITETGHTQDFVFNQETFTNIQEYTTQNGMITINFKKPVSSIELKHPIGGLVKIVSLLQNAEIPTDTFLQALEDYMNADDIRPITDKVECEAPQVKDYEIEIEYWINIDDKQNSSLIQNKVNTAVEEYKIWQGEKLNRDINPDELIFRVKKAGAKRLKVVKPEFIKLSEIELAKCTNVKITYKGLESE